MQPKVLARLIQANRIRKKKCDEGRPSCQRCLSTGRVCDGYGVWGGGNNPFTQHPSSQISLFTGKEPGLTSKGSLISPTAAQKLFPLHLVSADEHICMEWFIHRTATKLPGAFTSDFWTTLLPQASYSEPAVLHAIITLASIHKSQVLDLTTCADTSELFALQHYTRATGDLRRKIETRSRTSTQVALIACAIFVQLEYLRGCYQTALTHLRHGLVLLEDQARVTAHDDHVNVEPGILQIFTTMFIQARLLGQDVGGPRALLALNQEIKPVDGTFQSAWHARLSLEYTLLRVFDMHDQVQPSRRSSISSSGQSCPPDFNIYERSTHLLIELDTWLEACEMTVAQVRKLPRTISSALALFGLRLLHVYRLVACIMIADCTSALSSRSPTDSATSSLSSSSIPPLSAAAQSISSSQDSSTNSSPTSDRCHNEQHSYSSRPQSPCLAGNTEPLFHAINEQSRTLYKLAHNATIEKYRSKHESDNYSTSTSIADMGWIAPLYFTAINGPTTNIRRDAIDSLHCSLHREGVFNAVLVATVAERVLEIEQNSHDIHSKSVAGDSGKPCRQAEVSLPPDKYRVSDVQVDLPEGPDGILLLKYSICSNKSDTDQWVKRQSVYDLRTGRWTSDCEIAI
ncbi:hypothetical protein LTR10_012697 [Elasticomyces elasticus]|uniref:Zn(2)-C6 fungal-type domain-containing protein n=1 Tax=Exophiala sideris TaxID=1016849 RepID=A0ABR0JR96_9EURO|nr:hypothetical protein LTR10_012697 [Elasticomyces elasticus]KAK5034575.1 hypothetical protein LTR13_006230 [Exophiala sideris]KAK5040104.1 hypothetical protein LTS07_000601 [Exophiala sideris]KAK5068482.1 hypothetical protein LTR69_000602 [Exophiala sideris]